MKLPLKHTALIISFLAIGGLSFKAYQNYTAPSDNLFEVKKNLDIFHDVFTTIDKLYVDEPEPGKLMKTGIDAMLKSLDTNYIPESKVEDIKFMTTGQYGGIGSLIRRDGDFSVISEPYEGFPAHKAGLKAGDKIVKIDGKSIEGLSQKEVSEKLKGEANSSFSITVERPNTGEITKTITREKVQISDVPYYGMIDNEIGYIKLTSFTKTASENVIKAFEDLKSKHNMKKVVLDLRNNGGGLLVEAVKIVNMFVDKGVKIVEMKGRISQNNKIYSTRKKALDKNIELAVLVNGRSASASEIVSGAIQDLDRGVIIGTRSFGKGLVQQPHKISYGAFVKVTVAKYHIPSGRCIQKLDYSNKNDKGTAEAVADSLLNKFKTKNGRDVFDGRGIDPDVEVDKIKYSELTKALVSQNIIFDFCTEYAQRNETIDSAEVFTLSDTDFKQFIAYANSQDFEYTSKSLEKLEELEEITKNEKYSEETKIELEALKAKLKPNKSSDLIKFKKEIKELLENEIVSRYYYQNGRIKNSLKYDSYIQHVKDVLNNKEKYNSILGN